MGNISSRPRPKRDICGPQSDIIDLSDWRIPMISAVLLALVSLSAPASAPATAAYAGETITAMKGHATPAKRAAATRSHAAPVACHPEPSKGRACRHTIVQAEQAERAAALAVADVDAGGAQQHAR
jgi:hypothetical protein